MKDAKNINPNPKPMFYASYYKNKHTKMEKLNFDTITVHKQPNYMVDVDLMDIKHTINRWKKQYDLDLQPGFQRGYVWTEKQQRDFIEYLLKGGQINPFYFNKKNWMGIADILGEPVQMQLIDGAQRLNAIFKFLRNELTVFGGYTISQIENLPLRNYSLKFGVHKLSEKEAVEWYISMNNGGTAHTEQDINVAREYLEKL